jgi:hypothetical protein
VLCGEAVCGTAVASAIPADRSAPARRANILGNARQAGARPHNDSLQFGVACFGRIDRRIGEPPCARRRRRTEARMVIFGRRRFTLRSRESSSGQARPALTDRPMPGARRPTDRFRPGTDCRRSWSAACRSSTAANSESSRDSDCRCARMRARRCSSFRPARNASAGRPRVQPFPHYRIRTEFRACAAT